MEDPEIIVVDPDATGETPEASVVAMENGQPPDGWEEPNLDDLMAQTFPVEVTALDLPWSNVKPAKLETVQGFAVATCVDDAVMATFDAWHERGHHHLRIRVPTAGEEWEVKLTHFKPQDVELVPAQTKVASRTQMAA